MKPGELATVVFHVVTSSDAWAHAAAIGTIAAAVATLVLAIFTWRLARSATTEAKATRALANAAQRDREILWTPALSVDRFDSFGKHQTIKGAAGMEARVLADVLNSGGGPAISTRLARQEGPERWFLSTVFDVPANGGRKDNVPYFNGAGPTPWELFTPAANAADQNRRTDGALFCRDALQRQIRFPIVLSGSDALVGPPEIIGHDALGVPPWAVNPQVWEDWQR